MVNRLLRKTLKRLQSDAECGTRKKIVILLRKKSLKTPNMSCKDENIKELLPAYRSQILERQEMIRIEQHLNSCADCREELALLQALSEDEVPDPGEAFWAAIPAHVFRGTQEEKTKKRTFDPARLWSLLATYRLAAAAATVGVLLILAWFTVRQHVKEQDIALSGRYEYSDEIMTSDDVSVGGLDSEELETASIWANAQLASLSDELARSPVSNFFDADVNEELSDLNTKEMERLSDEIEQWKQEG
jgi:hypothetical protein